MREQWTPGIPLLAALRTRLDKPTPSSDSSELNDLALEEIVDTQMTDDLQEQIDEIMEQV